MAGMSYYDCAPWRGSSEREFNRVRDIVHACLIPIPSDTDTDEYETESDSEDEREKKKKREKERKKWERKKNELKKRMREIESSDTEEADEIWDGDESTDEIADEEELLDELQYYVRSVDVIRALDVGNLLYLFLRYALSTKHAANIRAKGAEVVATLVQNPANRHLVIEEMGLHRLLRNLKTYPDATSRNKAGRAISSTLRAISSLIRNNKPGITAFRHANGYAALRKALNSERIMFLREVLDLILYLLRENSSDYNIVTELGLPRIMMHLASNDDLDVRVTALRCLLILARDEGGNSGQLVKNDDKLKQVFEAGIKGISAMDPEERRLLDSLWHACYNYKPSSLGEKSLLVLPGEDAPAPDVASKLVEPSLIACAAAQAVDRNSISEKKKAPLLLGPDPPSAATPIVQSESRSKRGKKKEKRGEKSESSSKRGKKKEKRGKKASQARKEGKKRKRVGKEGSSILILGEGHN